MNRVTAAAVVVALVAASACGGAGASRDAGSGGGPPAIGVAVARVARAATAADPRPAAEAINSFGADLYRQLAAAAEPGANLAVSPTSLGLALAMVRPGARGTTAAEMDAVLHGLASSPAALDAINSLDRALAARSGTFQTTKYGTQELTLRVASAAFAQKGGSIVDGYLRTLASSFGAGVNLVDFSGDPDVAREQINAWVSDRTNGRVPAIAGPGSIDRATLLALANAVYLKAPWKDPFDAPVDGPFTRPDGASVQVPMMTAHLDQAGYASGAGWQAVDIPYAGDRLAMTLIVPEEMRGFGAKLDGALLGRIVTSLEERRVTLTVPPFAITSRSDIVPVLAALGMPAAVDPARADLSGISANAVSIDHVLHEVHVTIDPNGTEASAATLVAIPAAAYPGEPVTLVVNRPFLFAIRDLETGAVLFLGRVADPAAHS